MVKPTIMQQPWKRFAKKFKMKILGEISHILGMDVKVDVPEHTIHLSQQQYIRNTYNTFKEYGINNYTTPMDPRAQLSKAMSPTPGSEEADIMKEIPYRELIGTLLWVANGTRPDVSYAVYKNSSIKLPKRQKKQEQIRMWSYDQTDTHTPTQEMTPTSTPHVNI